MEQYIPKSAVVEELERLYDLEYANTFDLSCGKKIMLRHILLFLNTIEAKEVDINKEISQFIDANFGKATIGHKLSLKRAAKHFFELGLKAQKGE